MFPETENSCLSMQGSLRVGNKYTLLEKIGQGNFGEVHRGCHYKTLEPVAIKFESAQSQFRILKHETTILKYLHEHGCRTVPLIHWFGIFQENVACVMSFYECSLLDLRKSDLSKEKVDRIMASAISIIESIHTHYVLHRDIKPQNFMIRTNELYIIDFGLSTFYLDDKLNHLENLEKKDSILGSPKYASYNIHCGENGSRRDDLISLGYMYLVLFGKTLPWENGETGLLLDNDIEFEEISENNIFHKKNIRRKELKSWENMETISLHIDNKIHTYLKHCYTLGYKESPNYEGLFRLFAPTEYSR